MDFNAIRSIEPNFYGAIRKDFSDMSNEQKHLLIHATEMGKDQTEKPDDGNKKEKRKLDIYR
jgi:hypothetical protein